MADTDVFVIAKKFALLMDNLHDWPLCDLSENAIMDWFGRSFCGRDTIVSFLKTCISKMHHTIESVTIIPPINHRYYVQTLQRSEAYSIVQNTARLPPPSHEDCSKTPENTVHPNLKDLIKAPLRKRKFVHSVGIEGWKFIEIKGRLHLEEVLHDGKVVFQEKVLHRIVLGYSDQIHFIVYEGKIVCRKKLLSLFNMSDK